MGVVYEFDTKVSRRLERRGSDGKPRYMEYVVIPKSIRGEQSLHGKRVHVRIEVLDP